MDCFSKFLRSGQPVSHKPPSDYAAEFHKSWILVKNTLVLPDERQLTRGIQSTDVPIHLKSMVDSLVWESTRTEEGVTGPCLEYFLKNDILGQLVRLSEFNRPSGIQLEVLRSVQSMVVLLDEQFLVHSVIHRAVLRLLRTCIGDEIQEQLDGRTKLMGAAGAAVRSQPSEYEEDLVDLLCLLCSRIRTYRELLMIFFYDKHWFHSESLSAGEERNEISGENEDEEDADFSRSSEASKDSRSSSPCLSQETVKSAPVLSDSTAKKPEYEFLLFNYLLRFVHREGKIGDFARAGLLFLMDVAMSPGEPMHHIAGDELSYSSRRESNRTDPITDATLTFAEYILDGDFSEVLAAGLSAVYSLLPSKLFIEIDRSMDSPSNNGMIIGGAMQVFEVVGDAFKEKNDRLGVEVSTDGEFKSRLDHFLKVLEFLQDVLRRKSSHSSEESDFGPSSLVGSAIVQAILDAIRQIFLRNVLYPSILECSDVDGSAVAVMSYIDIMVRTLQDSQLGDLLVDFLLSDDDSEITRHRPRFEPELQVDNWQSKPDKDTKLNRRKSSAMLLLEMEAPDAKKQSEYYSSTGRFTLKDLLLSNLRSPYQPTVAAALQLLNSIMTYHCSVTAERLLVVRSEYIPTIDNVLSTGSRVGGDEEETFMYPENLELTQIELGNGLYNTVSSTYAKHEREMKLYLDMVSTIDPSHDNDPFSTGYDHYLRDAILSLQIHVCHTQNEQMRSHRNPRHQLNPDDPFVSLLLQNFRTFFSNTPEVNIALTDALSTFAFCPDRSMTGWLTFSTEQSNRTEVSTQNNLSGRVDDGDDCSVDSSVAEFLESATESTYIINMKKDDYPVIYIILHSLVEQLSHYRQSVPDFDNYLTERRRGLLFSENLNDALSLTLGTSINQSPNSSMLEGASNLQIPETPVRQKTRTKTSAWSNLLSPRRTPRLAKDELVSNSSQDPQAKKNTSTNPFIVHYQHTTAVTVESFIAPEPFSTSWAPSKFNILNAEEQDIFGSKEAWSNIENKSWDTSRTADINLKAQDRVLTLSLLLDNVVILEESIKELAAIIHARRCLGIDIVRYI